MKLSQLSTFKDIYQIKDNDQLIELAQDIRDFLNDFVNKNKGHIGSNLGVVELTLSILSYFDLEKTIVLFDTGHQSHVFKLLVHGIEKFNTLKQYKGLSNFQEIKESEYDWISTGHSSTSLAYQFGYALASDKQNIISVIGDAAFFGSYTLPGLINLQNTEKRTITIVNDNNQAIGENSLAIKDIKMYVESLGFKYIKCEDGHDFEKLFNSFDQALNSKEHVVIHCITKKAFKYKGENELFQNHSVESKMENSYSKLIANELEKNFTENDFLVCPAMLNSSNFDNLKNKFNKNVIDVGINEEFGILTASAIANTGKKTFVSIYSTFFQRVFDQLVHDVFRNNLSMTFLIDRGGLNYSGGVSHHGIYDVSLVNNFENSIIAQPYSLNDLKVLTQQSYNNKDKQFFLRYENLEAIDDQKNEEFEIGKWDEIIYNKNNRLTLISYGNVLNDFKTNIENNNLEINLINARYINPIDKEMIKKHKENNIFVYEQVINRNNLFSNIKREFNNLNLTSFAFSKTDIQHGSKELILKELNMDVEYIINKILEVKKHAKDSW
ncbi:1-deoxy-D-xylulose-5-phosphate synthase N-terminal domain-containing protein [Spiroplasma sp. BIUS-1]|uniref:1-deoxy-D-xylulose-5-phosphate synthase N-terminal domain-containing protein n=1 Tax=Spiroplasma sp. BIUS-1 TaxID=216964 RepID=UPI0013979C38|nr:1-deoxy-D-xylulose-5-phosphate synthase N-terminal domain-containing protein [Spiroplasma sp. BIUS-1]QHX36688.1 1-deoxy-D-xylulose-5-phosphate synthase [Spiroplasma sp. BIUS-1]